MDKLRARIDAVDRGLDGVLGVAVKDLKSGATVGTVVGPRLGRAGPWPPRGGARGGPRPVVEAPGRRPGG